MVYDPATGTSSQPSRIGDWPDTVPGLSSFTTLPNDAAVKKWVTISADTDMMAQDHVKFGFSAWAKRKYLDWEIHDIFDDKDDKSKEIRALFGQYLCRQISVFLQKRRLSDPALAGADLEIIGPGGFEYLEDWKDWNMPRSGLQKCSLPGSTHLNTTADKLLQGP